MSRWHELFERQHSQERSGTADPATHAQERTAERSWMKNSSRTTATTASTTTSDAALTACSARQGAV